MLRTLTLLAALLGAPALAAANAFDATLEDFRRAPGTAQFLSAAYGYAVFPTIGKGGLLVGGAYGKGRVYRGSAHVGDTSVAQLSIGFQLGGQAYSQLVVFRDRTAFDRFTSGSFEFGAEASAVALTLGAQARAGTAGAAASGNESGSGDASASAGWVNGMVVFTLAKGGLMYEAAIGGQKFSFRPVSG